MSDGDDLVNIGRGQQNLRWTAAVIGSVVTVGVLVGLTVFEVNRLWRLALYLPLVIAAGGYFEAKARTCVAQANNGTCSMEDGFYAMRTIRGDKITDPVLAARLRKRAQKISLQIQAAAIGLTLLAVLLPF
jgi:hypothetical protein